MKKLIAFIKNFWKENSPAPHFDEIYNSCGSRNLSFDQYGNPVYLE